MSKSQRSSVEFIMYLDILLIRLRVTKNIGPIFDSKFKDLNDHLFPITQCKFFVHLMNNSATDAKEFALQCIKQNGWNGKSERG